MAFAVAVVNQKGGVGKTTTAVNLAASLGALGCSVLLIDLDAQANATTSSGCAVDTLTWSVEDVLLGRAAPSSVVQTTDYGYALLPASYALAKVEWQLMQQEGRELILKHALTELQSRYDYIIMDSPPALNIISVNAMLACDELLVPVQCEFLALEGLTKLLRTIRALEQAQQCTLPFYLIRTLFDGRIKLSRQVSEELVLHFRNQLYHTVIPRTVRLAEAPSHAKPVLFYEANNQGALMYLALASEMMQRHHKAGLGMPLNIMSLGYVDV